MTYTAEKRADKNKTQKLLEAAEIKTLQKINKTLRDKIRSG